MTNHLSSQKGPSSLHHFPMNSNVAHTLFLPHPKIINTKSSISASLINPENTDFRKTPSLRSALDIHIQCFRSLCFDAFSPARMLTIMLCLVINRSVKRLRFLFFHLSRWLIVKFLRQLYNQLNLSKIVC